MQNAETVLGVLRERGRRGLPLNEIYRQLFNPKLYLLAYGRIYSNKGAMTPGATPETADGMSMGKIGRIIDAIRHERYRFSPARRSRVPGGPVEVAPPGFVPAVEQQLILAEVLAGMELGAWDQRMVAWLAGWDAATVLTIASWIVRARGMGPAR